MMKRWILLLSFLPLVSSAEQTPRKGELDPRIRMVNYNPLNVVKISTYYGVSTHIQFSDSESIENVAIGDDQAWKVVPRANHLFVKPTAERADTNLTVVTNKRLYNFILTVNPRSSEQGEAWADPNLIFSLTFQYPDEKQKAIQVAKQIEEEEVKLNEIRVRLADKSREGKNFNYWVAGSEEVSPTVASDDGRFVFLTFNANRDMPAIYSVNEKRQESLINTHVIDGNTIVIQGLAKELILRKGESVASVLNKSFDPSGGEDNVTGTIVPTVQRVIKKRR